MVSNNVGLPMSFTEPGASSLSSRLFIVRWEMTGSKNTSRLPPDGRWGAAYPTRRTNAPACHNAGLYDPPDQTKAVGVTIDPGNTYTVHTDDILIGPAAAACTACHNEPAVKGH